MLKSRSPSLGTISTVSSSTNNSMIDIPIPSVSITNKPSSGTSVYHTCRSVLDRLSLVEGMTYYLDYENMNLLTVSSASSVISSDSGNSAYITNDPLTKLWELCRRGTPLATLFNALNPVEPLKVDFSTSQVNDCKKIVYHFIVACRNQLLFKEEDVFTLSDLFKDNTNGFVKVVNTIDLVLQLLVEKGIISSLSNSRNSLNAPKDTRDKVVLEMLETERKYVQDLEILQNYMRELHIQHVLNPDTIHYLFGNLNTLVDFQRRFLIQLEEVAEKSAEEQNFGLLFCQNEDQFQVYEPYCSNYFSAQDLVVQETPKLQKLADILNPIYELPSMLIKPIQRICKYPLLLQQLIKSTNLDWEYLKDLQDGLESIKRVTEKVNETQRKYENIKVVDELKRRIDEMRISQIDSFGSLLLYDKLTMRQIDESDKEMFIYFFERTFLICKEAKDATKNNKSSTTAAIKKKRRGSLQPKGLIVLSKITCVQRITSETKNWCLSIDWKDREMMNNVILVFRIEEQIKLWESTLSRRIKKPIIMSTPIMSTPVMDTSRSSSGISRPRKSTSTTTSSSGSSIDYFQHHYPASPISSPSSPTATTRISQASSHSTISNKSSPLADIVSKFMSSGDDYSKFPLPPPPPRNQSHSPFPTTTTSTSTTPAMLYKQQQQQNIRARSQSSPNIHNNESSFISSRTLYQTSPPSPSPSPLPPSPLKIKLNYNDGIYVIMCSMEISFIDLIEKVDKKIRLIGNLQAKDVLKLKYQDEDGDLITLVSDEDVQMAIESKNHLNTINLFVSV